MMARRTPITTKRLGRRLTLSLSFGFFEIVGDAQPHAGGVIHLARRLLRVLQLGQPVLHLRKLLLDQVFELRDFSFRDLERVFVELLLLRGQAHGPADLLTSRESSRVPKNGVNAFVAGAPERGPRDDKRRVRTRSGEHHRLPSYGLTSTMTVRHILTGTPYFVAGRNRALRTPSRTASLTPLLMGIPCWSRAS